MYITTLISFAQSHYSGTYGIDHVAAPTVPVIVVGAFKNNSACIADILHGDMPKSVCWCVP